MPTLALDSTIETASAASHAIENWKSNHRALALSQPSLVQSLGETLPQTDWVFARDGALTAMLPNGRWWADCSVPLLGSRAMLKTLQSGAASSALLCPAYAGMVVAARDQIGPWATLLVIQPDVDAARMILACHDFSSQINRHRLWLATGENWQQQLREIYSRYPGLATPVQFIRTKLTPEPVLAPIISDAEVVFAEVVAERNEKISSLKTEPVTGRRSRAVLLIGATQFRLWDDGASILQAALSNPAAGDGISAGISVTLFDTDEPLAGSPLGLLEAAKHCGGVITANLCRPDCNNLISTEIPWITWMTQPGAPPFETAGPKDWLILADPAWRALARKAGWPEPRVKVCGFPMSSSIASIAPVENPRKELALLSNTRGIEIPASVKQFSSHRLLWDLIDEELAANPFAVQSIDEYLADRSGQLNISDDALDRRAFIQQLIVPAYEQGLARVLISSGFPLSLWGEGWPELEAFASAARGPVTDRATFGDAVARATALVYCWPDKAAHPIETLGKPVVHRSGNDRAQFVRNVQRALTVTSRQLPKSDDSLARVLREVILF